MFEAGTSEPKREIDLPRAAVYGVGQILEAGIHAILGKRQAELENPPIEMENFLPDESPR